MGALGVATKLRFGTGVTPPGYRYHPAIIAQAAATLEAMFPGRFYLGLGAGEALNEHIVGDYWPEAPVRLERLRSRSRSSSKLFTGKVVKHRSQHFNVESAKLYTLPDDAAADLRRHLRPDPGPAHRQDDRRPDHRRRGRREAQDADRALREGRPRGRQGPGDDAARSSRSRSPSPTPSRRRPTRR